jgi:hypothetical protein
VAKVSKTILFFDRIFLFSTLIPALNKTAAEKTPQSAHAIPSVFSQLYLRKIKIPRTCV